MLEGCQKYVIAINAKGKPFPVEPLIMALILEQHKMINRLQEKRPIPKQDSSSVPRQRISLKELPISVILVIKQ
jgi:hypothetical protein